MTLAGANTIVLKSKGHHDEGVAGAAITPGMAVELQADGKYDQMTTAQAGALKRSIQIAKEDDKQGNTITDAYALDDIVFFYSPVPGDHVALLVKLGEDIDIGDKLIVEGGGSGLFIEAIGTETKFQFEALEDSVGALAANAYVACRCIAA